METFIMTERAPGCDATTLRTVLAENHSIHHMLICPSDFCWPLAQLRAWTFSTRNDQVSMTCSFQQFCEETSWFKICMLPGRALVCEGADRIEVEKRRLVAKRGTACWESTMSGPQLVRLDTIRSTKKACG